MYRSLEEIEQAYLHLKTMRHFSSKQELVEYCEEKKGPLWLVRYSSKGAFRVEGPLRACGIETACVHGHNIPILLVEADGVEQSCTACCHVHQAQLAVFYAIFSTWNDAHRFLRDVQQVHEEDVELREFLQQTTQEG